jgi:hypothetical protein
MVSSKAKNGFNCVSCGTHGRWTSLRHVIRQNENPGVRAGFREPSCTGLGQLLEGSTWETHRRVQRFLTEHPARRAP